MSNIKYLKIIVFFIIFFYDYKFDDTQLLEFLNKFGNNHIQNMEFFYIVCLFGQKKLERNHRIRKYFLALDKFVPNATVIFAISKYTKFAHSLIHSTNIRIKVERFGEQVIDDIKNNPFFFNAFRFFFYSSYLKNHSNIKYAIVSDDDTLFFRDGFTLLTKNKSVVHFMQDIFPFSNTTDLNYKWANSWLHLNESIKKKCLLKPFNKSLLSDEIRNLIPLNCGMMIGPSEKIIKISELMFSRFNCTGNFPNNAEQGLLNYLDLSGELRESGISIFRHNINNSSLISCPELLPKEIYYKQVSSKNLIAIHHHDRIKEDYISKSPYKIQILLNNILN